MTPVSRGNTSRARSPPQLPRLRARRLPRSDAHARTTGPRSSPSALRNRWPVSRCLPLACPAAPSRPRSLALLSAPPPLSRPLFPPRLLSSRLLRPSLQHPRKHPSPSCRHRRPQQHRHLSKRLTRSPPLIPRFVVVRARPRRLSQRPTLSRRSRADVRSVRRSATHMFLSLFRPLKKHLQHSRCRFPCPRLPLRPSRRLPRAQSTLPRRC